MHGSTSPAKKGLPSHSGGPQPCHVTWSRTRPTARRASALAGSSPRWRSSHRTCIVEFHPRFHAAPPHRPSAACRASSRAPQPSVATRARSAATSSAGASVRSRITCQRIDGSESSSQRMTDAFGACGLAYNVRLLCGSSRTRALTQQGSVERQPGRTPRLRRTHRAGSPSSSDTSPARPDTLNLRR